MSINGQTTDKKEEKRTMSPGERAFDIGAYGVVGGVINFLISLGMGYSARYGKLNQIAKPMEEGLMKAGLPAATAKDFTMTTALMMGGNTTLPFVKALEDHKETLVDKANEAIGCGEHPLKHEHKQTWGSMIKSRLAAWGLVFASFRGFAGLVGGEKFDAFEKKFAKHVICDPLSIATHVGEVETKAFKLGRVAALDVFATSAASAMLYVFTRMFSKSGAAEAIPVQRLVHEPSSPQVEDDKHHARSFVERLNQASPQPQLGMS